MSNVVIDTHAAIWYLKKSSEISTFAFAAIYDAIQSGETAYVASISLVEIIYLVNKGRLAEAAYGALIAELSKAQFGFSLMPLDLDIAQLVRQVSRDIVPDYA